LATIADIYAIPAAVSLCIIDVSFEGEVHEPINKFATALWVLAVLVLLSGVGEYFLTFGMMKEFSAHVSIYVIEGAVWKLLMSGLVSSAQLAGFGVIIELIDQIRWNALQRSK
jgi:hypothetical protein